ncbi:MAG: ABC transporter ATP-binding protein [Armatimonadetes bacterium]|nr:ABC transporter ATP-binding protein [Armatimonadota bacterium]
MSETAISVQGLHKEFALSHSGVGSLKTLALWWRPRKLERLHVLKGLDFDVRRGQCVAVVGRNGAGKSTLLSLLARVYKPTSGTIEVKGRIAPLLELGAGFHQDLTGLENILFNGMILGLTRKQALERTPAIVEFAELGSHIDAPVRTYSSGMQARLGFSVAVHVDAEVLIVDEVLAVGDQAFQEKCYARIAEFQAGGGTVLFVSHDMDAVRRVAHRVVWLKGGQVVLDGPPEPVIAEYLSHGSEPDGL